MGIASYIKEIGRGREGARPLSQAQAQDLLTQVYQGQVSDLELGAFCLAMRVKGETPEELMGFAQATLMQCLDLDAALAAAPRGVVLLPSYNGSRKLPNLTALLAALLARQGVAVLVHGPTLDPTRVTTAGIFAAAGWPRVDSATALQACWQQGQPAFIDTATLCAPLARLLDVRWTIGLRNPGHTVAKLLDPFARTAAREGPRRLRVVNHTHPEYGASLAEFLRCDQANALLLRGTEGEPVADARRQPRFDVFLHGERQASLSRAPQEGVLIDLPSLPEGTGAQDTADWTAGVLAGRHPVPPAIQAQVDCLAQALAA